MLATQGIVPDDFVKKMIDHWTVNLNNIPNKALETAWRQIADAFNTHIQHHDDSTKAREWTVLSPPTGAGKTESIIVFASMLSSRLQVNHPGILVVTRRINDCDYIAERINHYGSEKTAIAYHSEIASKINMVDLKTWPTVVITHRAYEMALDFMGQEDRIEQTWPHFIEYSRNGQLPTTHMVPYPGQNPFLSSRRLVIVDECLDIVVHRMVELERLRRTLAVIPVHIKLKYPEEIIAIESMIFILETFAEAVEGDTAPEIMELVELAHVQLAKKLGKEDSFPGFEGLIKELNTIRFDHQLGLNDNQVNANQRQRHKELLQSLIEVYGPWAYYAKHNGHAFHTASLLIPKDIKGCVVMDATARTNIVYDLHNESRVIKPPPKTRNYSNVAVHVASGHRVGKDYMAQNGKEVVQNLLEDLNIRLRDRDVLIVTHQAVEPQLEKQKTTFKLHTAHWGKIDGSNDWRECDTVIIFGLPYLPLNWSANVFMSLQGPQDTSWLQGQENREFKQYADIRRALEWGRMSTNIIQAINRVRCRKTIDDAGNCASTDVYLMLPNQEKLTETVLNDIRKTMPGINIKQDWNYGHQKKRPRKSKWQNSLAEYLSEVEAGTYSRKDVVRKLGMSKGTMDNAVKQLKDRDSDLYKELTPKGVQYKVNGSGKTRTACFEKS